MIRGIVIDDCSDIHILCFCVDFPRRKSVRDIIVEKVFYRNISYCHSETSNSLITKNNPFILLKSELITQKEKENMLGGDILHSHKHTHIYIENKGQKELNIAGRMIC